MLLVADTVFGLVTALLVVVQATLLARIVARAFDGASLRDVTRDLVLLALTFLLRGVAAWAMEVAGVRAASTVLSKLRLDLVSKRLRAQPAALDGVEAGELAAAGVQGVDALAAYFGRYLPQVVLACVVPLVVLAWVSAIDPTSALIMLLTLPLVPVFMWLIGRYTEERTRERWAELRLLSAYFLDVVRGLQTLRLLNRSRAQAETIRDVSERYRRATIGSLRVAFLSASVLELAATLGVALVAVTIGVRLVDGGIGLQAGLTVLVLAPELYLPLRQLGAQFHASADGIAVAGRILTLLEAPAEVQYGGMVRVPSPSEAGVRFERVTFAYPAREALVLDGIDLELGPGETVALVGASGAGKSTVASLLLGLATPTAGRSARPTLGDGSSRGCRSIRPSFAERSPTTSVSAAAMPATMRFVPLPASRARTTSCVHCLTGTARSSATAGAHSRRENGGESRWPVPLSATLRSSSSTSRLPISTSQPPRSSETRSSASASDEQCC
jgi:ABC-type transport system involved in cytochrome bd biosynthesis fused ATPase/permease subunit